MEAEGSRKAMAAKEVEAERAEARQAAVEAECEGLKHELEVRGGEVSRLEGAVAEASARHEAMVGGEGFEALTYSV